MRHTTTQYSGPILALLVILCWRFADCKEYKTPIFVGSTATGNFFVEFYTPEQFYTNSVTVTVYRKYKSQCAIFSSAVQAENSKRFRTKELKRAMFPPLPCQGLVQIEIRPSNHYRDEAGNLVFPCEDVLAPIHVSDNCPGVLKTLSFFNINSKLWKCWTLTDKELCNLPVPTHMTRTKAVSKPSLSSRQPWNATSKPQKTVSISARWDLGRDIIANGGGGTPTWIITLVVISFISAIFCAIGAVLCGCVTLKNLVQYARNGNSPGRTQPV